MVKTRTLPSPAPHKQTVLLSQHTDIALPCRTRRHMGVWKQPAPKHICCCKQSRVSCQQADTHQKPTSTDIQQSSYRHACTVLQHCCMPAWLYRCIAAQPIGWELAQLFVQAESQHTAKTPNRNDEAQPDMLLQELMGIVVVRGKHTSRHPAHHARRALRPARSQQPGAQAQLRPAREVK